MPITKLTPENNYPYLYERMRDLQQAVPEAFADGKINWDTLREVLGKELEDPREEFFGLSWPGKREARKLASIPSRGTLGPVLGEGVNEDETENLFIEGDNLEVLKLLLKSYAGKIKMIYIDPPYNTGNDFIYNDNFTDPLEAYLEYTNVKGEGGELLTTNTRADGRFHTKWLNMMYPRLLLAHKMLKQNGVIFISIDDNEAHNLRQMMNEIFGEENFINMITIKSKPSAGASGGGEDKRLKKNVEYLLLYSKDRNAEGSINLANTYLKVDFFDHITEMKNEGKSWKYTRILLDEGEKKYLFSIKDGSGDEIKIFEHVNAIISNVNEQKKIINDDKLSVEEKEKLVYRKYRNRIFDDTNAQSSIRERVMLALSGKDGLFSIEYLPKSGKNKGVKSTVFYNGLQKRQLVWLADITDELDGNIYFHQRLSNLWSHFNWNNVAREAGISFPNGKKPIQFISQMMDLTLDENSNEIILDFFAGSGSTAHAVLDFNLIKKTNNKFILIQIPEIIDENNNNYYELIEYCKKNKIPLKVSKICEERIKKSILEINDIQQSQFIKLPLLSDPIIKTNGFKSFSLMKSNFKTWNDSTSELDDLSPLFENYLNPLINDWKKDNLMSEIILLEGFPLTSKIEFQEEFHQNELYHLTAPDFCTHSLFVCLDEQVHPNTVELLKMEKEDIFICLDSALSDELKTRLQDRFNVHVI